jgi:predicted restriction endonuclease
MGMKIIKPKRVEDKKALESMRRRVCVACGARPCDAAHIRSRKAGGPDEEWNLLALCRDHHMEQHRGGWAKFAQRYIEVEMHLKRIGWSFDDRNRLVRVEDE